MTETLGFAHFLEHADAVAWSVLALLLAMSLASWYWIAAKGSQALRRRRASRAFLASFWNETALDALGERAQRGAARDAYARVFEDGFDAIERHRAGGLHGAIDAGTAQEFVARSLKRSIVRECTCLEAGQTLLATVASTAPFVGLFGTVWGIYHALLAIGDAGAAGLQEVAGPVGEALIMTGIGLAVAIPASMAYNAFARERRNLRTGLEAFAHELLAMLATGTPPMQLRQRREDAPHAHAASAAHAAAPRAADRPRSDPASVRAPAGGAGPVSAQPAGSR